MNVLIYIQTSIFFALQTVQKINRKFEISNSQVIKLKT